MTLKEKKVRDKKYLRWVSSKPCMVCARHDDTIVPHHLLRAGGKGAGTKAGDDKVVPLCHMCHYDLHAWGDEVAYFSLKGWDYEDVKRYTERLWREWNQK